MNIQMMNYNILCNDKKKVINKHLLENKKGNQGRVHRRGDTGVRSWRLKRRIFGRKDWGMWTK